MKEMSKQVGPKVKQLWNVAMHVRHNFLGVVINTTAYHLGRYSLHLLLLKSSKNLDQNESAQVVKMSNDVYLKRANLVRFCPKLKSCCLCLNLL